MTHDILHAATQCYTCTVQCVLYVHSAVKCRPRQSYRVCSCYDISRTSSRPSYDSRISCCLSRTKSFRVLIFVVLLHRWNFFSFRPIRYRRIRRPGPHFRHIFFSRSGRCSKTTTKQQTAPVAPGTSRRHIFHVVLFDRYHGPHSSCCFVFSNPPSQATQ